MFVAETLSIYGLRVNFTDQHIGLHTLENVIEHHVSKTQRSSKYSSRRKKKYQ
jgi:hypothetical protein